MARICNNIPEVAAVLDLNGRVSSLQDSGNCIQAMSAAHLKYAMKTTEWCVPRLNALEQANAAWHFGLACDLLLTTLLVAWQGCNAVAFMTCGAVGTTYRDVPEELHELARACQRCLQRSNASHYQVLIDRSNSHSKPPNTLPNLTFGLNIASSCIVHIRDCYSSYAQVQCSLRCGYICRHHCSTSAREME